MDQSGDEYDTQQEDVYDEKYYKDLAAKLFPEEQVASVSRTSEETEETQEEEEEEETSTDSLVSECKCAWYTDSKVLLGEEEAEGISPSDLLFNTLTQETALSEDNASFCTPSSFTDFSENETSMVPFTCYWSLGFTINSRLINFTNDIRKEFYISNAHKGIIYNYQNDQLRFLHGHITPVQSASIDATGRWMVSGGCGFGSKYVVSDTIQMQEVLVIDNPNQDNAAILLSMAPTAKFFISVHGRENHEIKFWNWTRGSSTPDYVYVLDGNFGEAQRISYHPNNHSFMMFSFEKTVFFAHWNEGDNVLEDIVHPVIRKHIIPFGDCGLMENNHQAYAVAAHGTVTVFGNVLYSEHFFEHPVDTHKIYLKNIKVSLHPLKSMQILRNVIAILDDSGMISFYDKDLRIVHYLDQNYVPMEAMSFRTLAMPEMHEMSLQKQDTEIIMVEEDRSENRKSMVVFKENTKNSVLDFKCPEFIAGAKDGRVFLIDIAKKICKPFFCIADSPIAAMCIANTAPILCVAYMNGRVTKFNYDQLAMVVTGTDLVHKEFSTTTNSCINISKADIHIVVGRTSGTIVFLDSILKPLANGFYHHTTVPIERILFSDNNQLLAFYNIERTMFVMGFQEDGWVLQMKYRGHTAPITDMLFFSQATPRLFSIGEDRCMVEYRFQEPDNFLNSRVRIEETAIPLCFLIYPHGSTDLMYFLVANSEYKLKMFDVETQICRAVRLGPSMGCYISPIKKMLLLPNTAAQYLIFANDTHLGILKTPIDGNPYKHIGVLGNPNLTEIAVCNHGRYVFTYAQGEAGVLMWTINKKSVDILHYIGGSELQPFYCLIEDGSKGGQFKEIEDLFCYMQILHQKHAHVAPHCRPSIFVSDLPDLMRACGYYPSEFDTKLLMQEIGSRDFVNLEEFVKLLINHRPAHGVSRDMIFKHFNVLLKDKSALTATAFEHYMCNFGEKFTKEGLIICLNNLMSNETSPIGNDVLRTMHPITYEFFTENILGIANDCDDKDCEVPSLSNE